MVAGKETITNERIILNGGLKVKAGGSLTVNNAVLEVNKPGASLDPTDSNTSIHVDPDGAIEIADSVVTTPDESRAIIAVDRPAKVTVKNTTFVDFEMQVMKAQRVLVDNSIFVMSSDKGLKEAISLHEISNSRISGNQVVGKPSSNKWSNPPGSGIFLFNSHGNEISDNQIGGTRNGITLRTSWDNQIVGNSWTGPANWTGEGGIALDRWANNNLVERNRLEGAGSAILSIFQSTNNKVSQNTIRNAGMGIVLRSASRTTIEGNDMQFILEDAIRTYRSYDSVILNNRVNSAQGGISLFASQGVLVAGNTITEAERGLYLFDAGQNTIKRNEISQDFHGILLANSSDNVITENNFISNTHPASDEGKNNTWQNDYWGETSRTGEEIQPNGRDSQPASRPFQIAPVSVPEFKPIPFRPVLNDNIRITGEVVWEDLEKTVPGAITIENGGRLVLKNTTLTFKPEEMEADTWIHVKPGGTLEIYGSKISGPEKDHSLSIKVYNDARFIMKDSELRNAGSWVGTWGAAIGIEGEGAVIENNKFDNVYCAVSIERSPGGLRIARNSVTNSIEGMAIIGTTPQTIIENNRFTNSAIWAIQVWSIDKGISSFIRGNTIENGWGVGIYDAFGNSFTIADDNIFTNLRGPGVFVLGPLSQVDARQARSLSLNPSNIKAGDDVEVAVKLVQINGSPGDRGKTFVLNLKVNGETIDKKQVGLNYGESARIILRGKTEETGVLAVEID